MDANEHPEIPEDENPDHNYSGEDYDYVFIETDEPPPFFSKADFLDSLLWWAKHLAGYNFIMACTGVFILVASTAMTFHNKWNASFFSPQSYIEAACWYAFMANVCFITAAGFLILTVKRFPELTMRMEAFYTFFFKIGIFFSIGLNILMGIINVYLRSVYNGEL
jgi:hypothetical protein